VRLRLHSKVVEPGHHQRRLLHLTGLDAQENQARRLLNDITAYRARLERSGNAPVPKRRGRALAERGVRAGDRGRAAELRGKRAAAELYHELLEHRWFLSERAGRDVGLSQATAEYMDQILRPAPDERLPLEL